jgi:hypothetical protein
MRIVFVNFNGVAIQARISFWQRLLRQYLCFCTGKASKIEHCGFCVSSCTFVLVKQAKIEYLVREIRPVA